MSDISKIIEKVVFKKQIAKAVDFSKTKGNATYSSNTQFESFFKKILLSEEEILKFCNQCRDMIISRYGTHAYPIQYFEYEGFEFIAHYMDLGEGDDSILCTFWSLEEY